MVKRTSITDLKAMKARGEKIVMITAYGSWRVSVK